MNIVIFDTETTSLDKPFCYNVGYVIANTETHEILLRREYVIEQVWSNLALFSSAYYADKRPIYVSRMRGKKILLEKWGYVTQQMIRDFKAYEVSEAYAYNSSFDEKVFDFCCEWFKTINPLDLVTIYDIRGYVHTVIAKTQEYKNFCEKNKLFTEAGNYSTTAEAVYRYITNNTDFIEEHTALADSEIEAEILFHCIKKGCEFGINYKIEQSIVRKALRTLTIVHNGNRMKFDYYKKICKGENIYLS